MGTVGAKSGMPTTYTSAATHSIGTVCTIPMQASPAATAPRARSVVAARGERREIEGEWGKRRTRDQGR
eukprot:1195116-Prorocentrum_minimum.AAC.5